MWLYWGIWFVEAHMSCTNCLLESCYVVTDVIIVTASGHHSEAKQIQFDPWPVFFWTFHNTAFFWTRPCTSEISEAMYFWSFRGHVLLKFQRTCNFDISESIPDTASEISEVTSFWIFVNHYFDCITHYFLPQVHQWLLQWRKGGTVLL